MSTARPCAICLHHPDRHINGECQACDPNHVAIRPVGSKIGKSSNHTKTVDPTVNHVHDYIPKGV